MRRLTEVEQTRNLSARSLSNAQLDVSIARLRRLKLDVNKGLKLNVNKRLKLNVNRRIKLDVNKKLKLDANRRLKLNMNKRLSLNMEEIQIILSRSLWNVAMDAVVVDIVMLKNNTRWASLFLSFSSTGL